MKKIILVLLFISTGAFAFQTPMQQSSNIATQLIKSISSDNGLLFLKISKISIGGNSAKVELLDNNGNCNTYPFEILTDEMGATSVKIMTNALAQCD